MLMLSRNLQVSRLWRPSRLIRRPPTIRRRLRTHNHVFLERFRGALFTLSATVAVMRVSQFWVTSNFEYPTVPFVLKSLTMRSISISFWQFQEFFCQKFKDIEVKMSVGFSKQGSRQGKRIDKPTCCLHGCLKISDELATNRHLEPAILLN